MHFYGNDCHIFDSPAISRPFNPSPFQRKSKTMLIILWSRSQRPNGDAAKSNGVSPELTAHCKVTLSLVVEMLGLPRVPLIGFRPPVGTSNLAARAGA
jgi:hypothetical protein